jgi:aldehyde:ferredoxin oxidoreductase
VPDMATMISEFYEYRGLGTDGLPTSETLEAYGLAYLADKIQP